MRAVMSKHVYCPTCNRQFVAIPGSECFCGCGTAFRVRSDGTGVEPKPSEAKTGSRPARRPSFVEA